MHTATFVYGTGSDFSMNLCSQLERGFKEGLTNALQKYDEKGEGEITNALDELQEKVSLMFVIF